MASVFGVRLKEIRQRAGLSQEDVARAAGVTLGAVSKIETGKVGPTWATATAIAKALGVSVAAFEVTDTPPVEVSAPEKPAATKRKPKK